MKRIIIDREKCDGCKNCTVACMQAHRTDEGSIYTLDMADPANESRNRIEIDSIGHYYPLFCRHCSKPACAGACMSGAMAKDPVTGLVQYDREQCASCFMCVMECPFGILKPDTLTNSYVVKCDFCADHGLEPSCVKSCPLEAITVVEVEA